MGKDYDQEARESARASLNRMADRDVLMFAGVTISWMVRTLRLNQLRHLVSTLDATFPPSWTDTGAVIELPDSPYDPRD